MRDGILKIKHVSCIYTWWDVHCLSDKRLPRRLLLLRSQLFDLFGSFTEPSPNQCLNFWWTQSRCVLDYVRAQANDSLSHRDGLNSSSWHKHLTGHTGFYSCCHSFPLLPALLSLFPFHVVNSQIKMSGLRRGWSSCLFSESTDPSGVQNDAPGSLGYCSSVFWCIQIPWLWRTNMKSLPALTDPTSVKLHLWQWGFHLWS